MRITRNWSRGCWLRRYSIEVCVSNVGPCQEIGRVVLPTCKYRAGIAPRYATFPIMIFETNHFAPMTKATEALSPLLMKLLRDRGKPGPRCLISNDACKIHLLPSVSPPVPNRAGQDPVRAESAGHNFHRNCFGRAEQDIYLPI